MVRGRNAKGNFRFGASVEFSSAAVPNVELIEFSRPFSCYRSRIYSSFFGAPFPFWVCHHPPPTIVVVISFKFFRFLIFGYGKRRSGIEVLVNSHFFFQLFHFVFCNFFKFFYVCSLQRLAGIGKFTRILSLRLFVFQSLVSLLVRCESEFFGNFFRIKNPIYFGNSIFFRITFECKFS